MLSLCCTIPFSLDKFSTFFSTSRDDSEILEFHNIPALVVDVYCAIFIELAAMIVPQTADSAPNCLCLYQYGSRGHD